MSIDLPRHLSASFRRIGWSVQHQRRLPFTPLRIRPCRFLVPLALALSSFLPLEILAATDQKPPASATTSSAWASLYHARLDWWSLRPPASSPIPKVRNTDWPRHDIDRFILARLEQQGLTPAAPARPRTLARRLSLILTGLPPTPVQVGRLAADASDSACDRLVDELLESPHFGERWARHWMDVVHYADTHGYEWDVPAKGAWRYRDYLVRAFNTDVPFQRLILEQIAGDEIEPRLDPVSGLNESLLGLMSMRLGERRHGDNAAAEGVTQEAVANIIDTVSKGFLATTVACAQCHDHKLDAISQQDYYAMAGLFMNTRWGARPAESRDPNAALFPEMRRIKSQIRSELGRRWINSRPRILERLCALPRDHPTNTANAKFPESIAEFWRRSASHPVRAEALREEIRRRRSLNATNLAVVADFSRPGAESGWRWEGAGLRHGLVQHGEPVLALSGTNLLAHLLPAGRWSHVWSPRLAGRVQSPLLDTRAPSVRSLTLGYAAGQFAARAFIIDHAFHSERMAFLNQPWPGWTTIKAGDFDTLEGGIDRLERRVYLEIATKSLNNYFPPRTGYGGVKESDLADERSWFGLSRVISHSPGQPRLDELGRFEGLLDRGAPLDEGLAELMTGAARRWLDGHCEEEDVLLLNEALQLGLLENETDSFPEWQNLAEQYRRLERRIVPERTVGAAEDWREAIDEKLAVRGNYHDFGLAVPRGGIAFLGGPSPLHHPHSGGRLEFARGIAHPENPLTARVIVNRIWQHLFGEGLVRTPDDFGRLGEKPSHPELLDYLALRFMNEGWSVKRLIRLLVTSSTWKQDGIPSGCAREIDPDNRLLHHFSPRRLDAESIRDSMLAVSGRLDPTFYGPPIDPPRAAEDPAKRLWSGPVDGQGRRSLYTKITLMEPPRFLAIFNQPIPKQTTGKRDLTQVPDQALALLNDPLVHHLAAHWAQRALSSPPEVVDERLRSMFHEALARPPSTVELDRLRSFSHRSARLRGVAEEALLHSKPVWQDVAHSLFNTKEFLYVF